jgi:hypothetical protein
VVAKARADGYDEGYKQGEEQRESDVRSFNARMKTYEDAISRFHRKTGVDVLRGWDPDKQFLDAFRVVSRLQTSGRSSRLEDLLEDLQKFGKNLIEHAQGELRLLKQLSGAGDKGLEPERLANDHPSGNTERSSDVEA